jgi:hypothetical protein
MVKRHLKLGHHLVAFLDVLGQRERFKGLRLPKTSEETAEVAEVLRQTAGFVLELRENFAQQFKSFEAGFTQTKVSVQPKFVGFSDSFVISTPLRGDAGDLVPIVTVFSALFAAAVSMLMALASKHLLRGGIDVGLATEIGPEEIYGTALEKAYVLESQEAESPRIVVGDELWNYLNVARMHFEQQSSSQAKSIAKIIEKMMGLIATDGDGKRVLDYLGPVMVETAGTEDKYREKMVKAAYEFVLAEQNRIEGSGNPKLIARYQALRQYFESRLPLWNLKPQKS